MGWVLIDIISCISTSVSWVQLRFNPGCVRLSFLLILIGAAKMVQSRQFVSFKTFWISKEISIWNIFSDAKHEVWMPPLNMSKVHYFSSPYIDTPDRTSHHLFFGPSWWCQVISCGHGRADDLLLFYQECGFCGFVASRPHHRPRPMA